MQKRFSSSLKNKSFQLLLTTGFLAVGTAPLFAQKTTSASPYSQYGLGQIREDLLPQYRSLGGANTAIRTIGNVYNTNPSNPASYSAARFSIFDAGLYGNYTQLDKGNKSDNTADFAFSHITMTFPMKRFGGISLGLLPYSDVGFRSSTSSKTDSVTIQKVLTGEGGLTKAYAGWGVSIFKNVSVGANVSYLFGTLNEYLRAELPYGYNGLDAQQQTKREIQGIIFDYGVQYAKPIGREYLFSVGYSGSLNNQIKERTTSYITRTQSSLDEDNQNIALDTINRTERVSRHLNLPLKHNIGIALTRNNHWLVAADFKYADWSKFQGRTGENSLTKNYGVSLGGQFTPDITSLNYMSNVDYRLGVRYNKTQYFVSNNDIKDIAVTFGLGMPLKNNQFTGAFSKINVSAEVGQMGTKNNALVRERYINLNIGFTLNDRWFRRNQLD